MLDQLCAQIIWAPLSQARRFFCPYPCNNIRYQYRDLFLPQAWSESRALVNWIEPALAEKWRKLFIDNLISTQFGYKTRLEFTFMKQWYPVVPFSPGGVLSRALARLSCPTRFPAQKKGISLVINCPFLRRDAICSPPGFPNALFSKASLFLTQVVSDLLCKSKS